MNFVTRVFGAIIGRVQDQLKQSLAWALPLMKQAQMLHCYRRLWTQGDQGQSSCKQSTEIKLS